MSKGIIIWLEFKDNILTPTVLISNELFIKQEGDESQVGALFDHLYSR